MFYAPAISSSNSVYLWDSRTHHSKLLVLRLSKPIHRAASSKFLIFGAAFIVYLHYNSWVRKETLKTVGDHAVKNSSQLSHSLHDAMQFTTWKNVAWMMFLNDVAWGETASHHLTEKGNRENAESKEVPTIQLYFLMLRILSWNLLFSYIYISTGKHKTKCSKSGNNLLNLTQFCRVLSCA